MTLPGRERRLTDRAYWTLAASAAALWRTFPVRGGGLLIDRLVLRRGRSRGDQLLEVDGCRFLVSFENPPETSLFLWHAYEPEVTTALRAVLHDSDTVVDVGANSGVLTVMMGVAVGPTGMVVAVDPSPRAVERVQAQARVNALSNVRAVQAALGATARRETFLAGRTGIGALPTADAEHTLPEPLDVEVMRLDDLAAGLGDVALVKIDTDGSELDVLMGAEDLLARTRPAIVFEFYPEGMRRRKASASALFELLERHGYRLLRPDFEAPRRGLRRPPALRSFSPVTPAILIRDAVSTNLVALHANEQRHADAEVRLRSSSEAGSAHVGAGLSSRC
jgi:FkbM family methyltransferase